MGVTTDARVNDAANVKLEADLRALMRPMWKSFGFSENWREDGFVVAFDKEEEEKGRAVMIALAKKYAQGAIYAYESNGHPKALRRQTVAAAMSDAVDADVVVITCDEPKFPSKS